MALKVAVVGVGLVGEAIVTCLKERHFPSEWPPRVAATRERPETLAGEKVMVEKTTAEVFDGANVVLFAGKEGAKGASVTWRETAEQAGAVCVDNGRDFRLAPDVPLVVPEVNAHAIAADTRFIASPNCSTIQLVVALAPLHRAARITRIVVATYQSTSGAGKSAMDELFEQTRGIFVNEPAETYRKKFTKQIAFNVIPHIDIFMDDGYTKEEWKMSAETRKILDPDIKVTATCARSAIFVGHAEAVNVEFDRPISEDEARAALHAAPGIVVVDHRTDGGYVTPCECAGEDAVYVSRIRKDPTVENGLAMWVVADNLRKGAALNTIQIAEELVRSYWEKAA